MKTKSFSILFALLMALCMSAGVFAQDFTQTWDENTVLTLFNELGMYFPDMFAEEDSDFLWTENDAPDYPNSFPTVSKGLEDELIAKAPVSDKTNLEVTYDPCGDGLIQFDLTITKMTASDASAYYYGDSNTTYVRNLLPKLTMDGTTYDLGVKTCQSTGNDGCHSVTFKKQKSGDYEAHLKGYLTVPGALVLKSGAQVKMDLEFSTYMTALWPLTGTSPMEDTGTVSTSANLKATEKKDYCQASLQLYNAFGYTTRAKYDENTGEARLQAVIRNYQSDVKRQNYVIPGEVFAFNSVSKGVYENGQRITDYTCKYTVYNPMNAAPLTNDCKFGEGISIPNHGMLQIDVTIARLSGDILRTAKGKNVQFAMRLGGMNTNVPGTFEPVDFPCPPETRIQVLDPVKPFMTFYGLMTDDPISPSGAYGVYEGGVWGMYQKCGKMAYMAVRVKNDGIRDEVLNLNRVAVAINGGTMMNWDWTMTSVEPESKNIIVLAPGEEVILIGRGKVTDYPYQLNADTAMTGAVNFTDYGLYLTGKVYSDHNNTRCY